MKVIYKGFEIEVKRDQALGGWDQLYYTVTRLSDMWFMIDSFEDSGETVHNRIRQLKEYVDDYIKNPKDYEDE